MTCSITKKFDQLHLRDSIRSLKARDESQLNFWGFHRVVGSELLVAEPSDVTETINKVVAYFHKNKIPLQLAEDIQILITDLQSHTMDLNEALAAGRLVKSGRTNNVTTRDFVHFASNQIKRPLKDHQLKAAVHLLTVKNGANFSVPGSGKTSVVLSVFHWLRSQGKIDAIFVVGPPSCFGPWRHEYEQVLGCSPAYEILAGGDITTRKNIYYTPKARLADLYLTSFQTLQNDLDNVIYFFNQPDVRFLLVMDEAHYIKQLDGIWANAIKRLAPFAAMRCILTGTPFPRSYSDSFNLFDVLWPTCSPISVPHKIRIQKCSKGDETAKLANMLESDIGPLFYRVRKSDLNLAPQVMHPPVMVQMNTYEKRIYDTILQRIKNLSKEDYFRDLDSMMRLRRGRLIRLRQCISYAKLLGTALHETEEDVLGEKLSIAGIITRYDQLETPAKLGALARIIEPLRARNEKVLIWSNFVGSLKLITQCLRNSGYGVEMIFGETPTETETIQEELTREKIVAEFCRRDSGVDILVANPAVCAESISLHKECCHAIYYDMSYNCAQYLQSLDRIHRVGGSETRESHYYFLQYEDTIDNDILSNVLRKAQQMRAIIDRDYPIYSLNMFAADEELEAYERLFR